MVSTSRNLRANPKVAWDIALTVIVVSPRAHDPTLLECDSVSFARRDLSASPQTSGNIGLSVGVVSPRFHISDQLNHGGVVGTRSDLCALSEIGWSDGFSICVRAPSNNNALLRNCRRVNPDEYKDTRDRSESTWKVHI